MMHQVSETTYEAEGRWGTASVWLDPQDDGRLLIAQVLRTPPVADPEARLDYAGQVLAACPVGMFRYLPMVHEIAGVSYTLADGVIDTPGCILRYRGVWHGETIDRKIEFLFTGPMPHVQSLLETKVDEDRRFIRDGVRDRMERLAQTLMAMDAELPPD